MARERRTKLTSSMDEGKKTTKLKTVGAGRKATSRGRTTTTGRRGTATSRNRTVGSTTRNQAVTNGNSLAPMFIVVILVIALGGGYFYYKDQQDKKRIIEQTLREEEEKKRLQAEEAKRLADKLAEEKKNAAKIRATEQEEIKRREAAERYRLEQEKAKLKAKEEENERKRVEAEKKAAEELKPSDEYLAFMKEGDTLLAEGKFPEASLAYKKAAAARAPEDSLQKARKASNAADLFATTMKQTKANPESDATNMYILTLKNGKTMQAKYDPNRSGVDEIAYIKDNGIAILLKPSEIRNRKKINQEDRNKQMLEALKEKAAQATDGVDWFLCGETALKYNMPPHATKIFIKTAGLDADIANNVMEYRASRLFASGALKKSLGRKKLAQKDFDLLLRLYPDSRAAKMLSSVVEEEAAVVAELSGKNTGSTADSNSDLNKEMEEAREKIKDKDIKKKDVAYADSLMGKCLALTEQAQASESRKKSNQCYKEALSKAREAVAIYQKYLKTNKNDAAVERKLERASKQLYWCKKLQTL